MELFIVLTVIIVALSIFVLCIYLDNKAEKENRRWAEDRAAKFESAPTRTQVHITFKDSTSKVFVLEDKVEIWRWNGGSDYQVMYFREDWHPVVKQLRDSTNSFVEIEGVNVNKDTIESFKLIK